MSHARHYWGLILRVVCALVYSILSAISVVDNDLLVSELSKAFPCLNGAEHSLARRGAQDLYLSGPEARLFVSLSGEIGYSVH